MLDAGTQLPIAESRRLKRDVIDGIRQDVEEAEEAHFYGLYKSCAVMCRRAMQLGLIEKGIKDGPIGVMLTKARDKGVLSDCEAYQIGLAVSGYGGKGAHDKCARAATSADDRVDAHPQCMRQVQRHISNFPSPCLEEVNETEHRQTEA